MVGTVECRVVTSIITHQVASGAIGLTVTMILMVLIDGALVNLLAQRTIVHMVSNKGLTY